MPLPCWVLVAHLASLAPAARSIASAWKLRLAIPVSLHVADLLLDNRRRSRYGCGGDPSAPGQRDDQLADHPDRCVGDSSGRENQLWPMNCCCNDCGSKSNFF